MALEANKIPMSPAINAQLARISTPLNVKRCEQYLKKHLDRDYARYILQGLQYGFSIGLNVICASQKKHSISNENPEVVDKYIVEEVDKGNIATGSISTADSEGYHINRTGVIPKRHQPG